MSWFYRDFTFTDLMHLTHNVLLWLWIQSYWACEFIFMSNNMTFDIQEHLFKQNMDFWFEEEYTVHVVVMWIIPSPSTFVSSLNWQLIYYIHLYANILCSPYVCLSIRQLNDRRLRKSSVKCFDFDVKQSLHHVKYMQFSSVSVIHCWKRKKIYEILKENGNYL